MSLLAELKRRNVFKASIAYLALGWVVVEVSNTIVPLLHLPESIPTILLWIGLAGLPFVVVFSWVYELTPEGLKRESEVDRSQSITRLTSRRLDTTIIALLVVAIGLFAFHEFRPAPPDAAVAAHPARDDASDPVGARLARDDASDPVGARLARDSFAPDDKSIAVLPFVDMSQAKDEEYFSDGIAEELLNLLAKIPELQVVARTSSFAFKGKEVGIADIAKKLNVSHILEGSVRKSGNKLRITAQLINATNNRHMWSETYDREMTDIFTIQDEIAAAVVAQLKVRLLGAAPTVRPVDPRIYPMVLQAKALVDRSTLDSLNQAIELYQKALAIDPNEAQAWSGLGRAYINRSGAPGYPALEGTTLAKDALNRALAINPDDVTALARLGLTLAGPENNLAAALPYFQRALALDPGNLVVLGNAAIFLGGLGRLENSLAVSEYFAAHDPVNPNAFGNLAEAYLAAGRWDQAIASARTALDLSPSFFGAHRVIGQSLLLGKQDAEAALAEVQAEPYELQRLIGVAEVQHALGNAAESDAALAGLVEHHGNDQAYAIAEVHAFRGDTDAAFEWLEKAAANGEYIAGLANQRMFAKLHGDPRWLAFLRQHNMAPEQLAAIVFEVKVPR